MSVKKKVLENSLLYTFSSLIITATGFLLLPLYTFFLTPKDYGIINLVDSFLKIALYVISMSLGSGIVRFYIDYKDDLNQMKRYIGTVIVFVSFSGIMFTMLGFLSKGFLEKTLFEGLDFYPYILITLITMSFLTLHHIHQNIMQAMQVGRKLTSVNLITFFFTVSLNILFIAGFKLGATGMLLAQLIIHVCYLFYIIYDLRKNNLFTFTLDVKILWNALKYSVPLMPHNLSTRIAEFTSRVIMNVGSSIATVGLYSVGLRFGALIDTVQSSVNRAFQPWFFEMLKSDNPDNKKQVIELSNLLLILYTLVYMVIGLFSQEAIMIMTSKNYIMAWTVIPILVVAYSVKSIYYFYVNILFYYKSLAKKIFISTLIGSFADIILALIFIPILGMYGAAIAFLLAKIIVVLIVYLMARSYNEVGFKLFHMIKVIGISLTFMSIGLYFSYTTYLTEFSLLNILYKVFILLVYIGFIYITNKKVIQNYIKSDGFKKIKSKFIK